MFPLSCPCRRSLGKNVKKLSHLSHYGRDHELKPLSPPPLVSVYSYNATFIPGTFYIHIPNSIETCTLRFTSNLGQVTTNIHLFAVTAFAFLSWSLLHLSHHNTLIHQLVQYSIFKTLTVQSSHFDSFNSTFMPFPLHLTLTTIHQHWDQHAPMNSYTNQDRKFIKSS